MPFKNKMYIQQYRFEKWSKRDYTHSYPALCCESTRELNTLVQSLQQTTTGRSSHMKQQSPNSTALNPFRRPPVGQVQG